MLPHTGLIEKEWLTAPMPIVLTGATKEWVTIIHHIEPYNVGDAYPGYKRAREGSAAS